MIHDFLQRLFPERLGEPAEARAGILLTLIQSLYRTLLEPNKREECVEKRSRAADGGSRA